MDIKPVILCVDDEKAILDLLSDHLYEEFGDEFEIEVFDDPIEALDYIHELIEEDSHQLVTVVSDHIMPGMSGDELFNEVNKVLPDVPKILLSGQVDDLVIRSIISKLSLYRFLAKPWEVDEVVMTIKQASEGYVQKIQLYESYKNNEILKNLNYATQLLSSKVTAKDLPKTFAKAFDSLGDFEFLQLEVDYEGFKINHAFSFSSNEIIDQETIEFEGDISDFKVYELVVPVNDSTHQIGFIYLANHQSKEPIDSKVLYILESLSAQLTVSLRNAALVDDIYKQKQLIEEKSKDITKSIEYAERIQMSLVSRQSDLSQYLDNFFVLYKPKDIVGGDFFWSTQIEEDGKAVTIVVVADCTGHGVPGSIMTVMGAIFLTEIVGQNKITEPNLILTELDKKVVSALGQDENQLMDGMDASICRFESGSVSLVSSSAVRPIYIVRRGELIEIKGTKMFIGYHEKFQNNKEFLVNSFELQQDDMIYLSSDGFSDQFGNSQVRYSKYMVKRFKQKLIEIASFPVEEQQLLLDKELKEWQGDDDQTDDVLVMGIKVPIN